MLPTPHVLRRCVSLGLVLAGLVAHAAEAAPPPPSWTSMLEQAKSVFSRRREDATLIKMIRSGEPKNAGRRTPTEIVPVLYQDVDTVYETKKWGSVQKQTMTLHYEHGLGGWAFVGFQWGEMTVMRAGKYPPAPPAPSVQEVGDAVKEGLREWHVKPEHIEKVQVTGKGAMSWLDEVPTAGYVVPVKVLVQDVIDRNAEYGTRRKTRFVCDFKVQLSLEDRVTWTMQTTVPDCAAEGCTLARLCRDTWGGGGGKKKR